MTNAPDADAPGRNLAPAICSPGAVTAQFACVGRPDARAFGRRAQAHDSNRRSLARLRVRAPAHPAKSRSSRPASAAAVNKAKGLRQEVTNVALFADANATS